MSFSEKVTAANKSEAKLAVIDAMNKIVARDPAHARDQKVILSNVGATIDLLHDDYTKDVVVCFSGAIGWTGSADPAKFEITSSSMGCSAYYVPRAA